MKLAGFLMLEIEPGWMHEGTHRCPAARKQGPPKRPRALPSKPQGVPPIIWALRQCRAGAARGRRRAYHQLRRPLLDNQPVWCQPRRERASRAVARRDPISPTERCMNYGRQEFFHPRFLDTKGTRRAFQLPLLDSGNTFTRPIDISLGHGGSVCHSRFPALAATIHYLSSILGHRLQRVQWLRDSHTRWYESISRRRGFRCCDYCWNRLWVVERRLSRRQCRIARSSRDHSPHSAASVHSVVHSLVRNWGAFKNTPDILLRDADCDVEHGGGCTQRSYR